MGESAAIAEIRARLVTLVKEMSALRIEFDALSKTLTEASGLDGRSATQAPTSSGTTSGMETE